MDIKEKLVKIVFKSLCRHIHKSCKLAENIADDLIADGVTVQDNTEISEELLQQLRNAPLTILHEEPTIEVVQEWVSVKDRLPKEGECVIVYDTRVDYIGMWEFSGVAWYNDDYNPLGIDEVTHWMPAPQPPKGE